MKNTIGVPTLQIGGMSIGMVPRRWTPSDLSGLVLALDSANGLNQSANVATSWTDLSGVGNTLDTAVGSPDYVTGQQNGRPCLRLTTASAQYLYRANTNLFGSGAYTVAMALKIRASAGNDTYFGNSTGSGGLRLGRELGSNKRDVSHVGLEDHTDGTIQTSTVETWIARRASGSAPSLLVNGVAQTLTTVTTTLTNPGATARLVVGAFWNGSAFVVPASIDLYFVHALTRVITDAEAAELQHYYAMALAL